MSSLPESPSWESRIHQLEESDRAKAGPGGVLNIQANQLANRTQFLRALVESAQDYREYTFYKTESDPDGTIAGLANTPEGKVFRVSQGLNDDLAFIYYMNNLGVAIVLTALLGRGSITNNVREYSTLPLAQNDVVAGNIIDGAKCWVTNLGNSYLADEYINNGGILEVTGRQMPSQQSVGEVADFSKQAASSLNKGEYVTFGDATNGTVTAEYITVDGTKTSSATRKLMAVTMAAGDTAFYKAKHTSKMTASEADIPNALFVADAGGISVIAPAPLALNVTSYTDGHFTATEPGTFYLNTVLYEDETRGTLISGVIGENIFYNPRVLGVEDVGVTVASNDIATRDMQAVVANGSPEDVTAQAEMVNNQVLFSNGAIQVIPEDSSTYGDWAIAIFPVRPGDVVEYYGWFNTFTTSTATYISQLDTRKNYIAQLLGDTGITGYNTVSATATHDGYIAIRVRLRDSGVTKTHTIKRKSALAAKALMSNFFASSSSDEVMINIYGTDSGARIPGYVDNAGAIISSVTRWYMTTHLD
ncbi:hypothetical protein ACV1MK_26395, partial [Klebsiella michiganensis]